MTGARFLTTPLLLCAHGLGHDDAASRRGVTGQRGPGAGEGPWYHAAQPLPGPPVRRRTRDLPY